MTAFRNLHEPISTVSSNTTTFRPAVMTAGRASTRRSAAPPGAAVARRWSAAALFFVLLPSGCTSGGTSAGGEDSGVEEQPVEVREAPTWTEESFDGVFHYFTASFVDAEADAWSVEDVEYEAAYAELFQTAVPMRVADALCTDSGVDLCVDFGLASEYLPTVPRGDRDIGYSIPFRIGEDVHALERWRGEDGHVDYWWVRDFAIRDRESLAGSEITLNQQSLGLEVPAAPSGVSWQDSWEELEASGQMHLTWDPPSPGDPHAFVEVSIALFVDDAGEDWRGIVCWLVDDGAAYLDVGSVDHGANVDIDRVQWTAVEVDELGLLLASARRGQTLEMLP